MYDLLLFLANKCIFLFSDHNARIINSIDFGFNNAAEIVLEIGNCEFVFGTDRYFTNLDVRPKNRKGKLDDYPIGLLRELLTGEQSTGVMDDENVAFLRKHAAAVIDCFADDNVERTRQQVKEIRENRKRERKREERRKKRD